MTTVFLLAAAISNRSLESKCPSARQRNTSQVDGVAAQAEPTGRQTKEVSPRISLPSSELERVSTDNGQLQHLRR